MECPNYGYTCMFHFQWHFSTTQRFADAYRLQEKKREILIENNNFGIIWFRIGALIHLWCVCVRVCVLCVSESIDLNLHYSRIITPTSRHWWVHLPTDSIPYRWVTFLLWLFNFVCFFFLFFFWISARYSIQPGINRLRFYFRWETVIRTKHQITLRLQVE